MTVPERPVPHSRLARALWFVLGWVAVALGGAGIVLPGLPSTGFFVAAAWCFARSSPRFEAWILNLPTIGPMVRDHRAGLGMPRRTKGMVISMIVGFSAASVLFGLRDRPLIGAAVAVLAVVGVAWILWRVPTREKVLAAS
jgi:uncharacterized protein